MHNFKGPSIQFRIFFLIDNHISLLLGFLLTFSAYQILLLVHLQAPAALVRQFAVLRHKPGVEAVLVQVGDAAGVHLHQSELSIVVT